MTSCNFALFVVLEIESEGLSSRSVFDAQALGEALGGLWLICKMKRLTGVLSEISTNSKLAGAWGFHGHKGNQSFKKGGQCYCFITRKLFFHMHIKMVDYLQPLERILSPFLPHISRDRIN